jgi:hypothetical protein
LPARFAKFADLDADARPVPWTIVVGMHPDFIQGQVLDGLHVVHRKVPEVKTARIPLCLRANLTCSQQTRMRGRGPARTARAMDGYIFDPQALVHLAAKLSVRDQVLPERAGDSASCRVRFRVSR